MKTLPFFSLGQRGYLLVIMNALLAISLTVLSFRYIQPKACYHVCGTSDGMACPSGSCRFGEQKAGWPLQVFVDDPGGGSPTGGWGMLGPEDPPLLVPLILDVLFYSILLWLALYAIQLVLKKTPNSKFTIVALPLNIFLVASLWIFYSFFEYDLPIGRGSDVQVYINTPTSTIATSAFLPIVSIPLQELVDNFGAPDYARFVFSDNTQTTTGIVLYWNSAQMFSELPQITKGNYLIKETTTIKRIVFSDEQQIIRIDGESLGTEKNPWRGYGSYQP